MKSYPYILSLFLLGTGLLAGVPPTGPIVFEEIAQRSGLTFVTDSSPTPNKNQPETMVGGVALLDYDDDGYLDVLVVNGAAIPSLQKESPKYWNRLYHNNHDGTFADVTEVSEETGIAKYFEKGMGIAIADYDGDGFMDIFVANDNRPNFLFHNLGGKKFEEVALESGVAYTQSGSAISGMGADFKDVDNDGRPDIWHTAVENESF